jgi:hypothetical protein
MEILPPRECERQLDPVLAHLLRRMSAPTQSPPSAPRAKPKHPDRDHLVALFHITAEDALPTAWARERQAKSVQVFVHTHARSRTPRCATVELTFLCPDLV